MIRQIFTFITLAIGIFLASAQPKYETRAAWLVIENGKDWPCGNFNPTEQQQQLCDILDKLVAANFNTIYVQVQSNGGVIWESSYLPAQSSVTGNGAINLSYDVAEFIISECHNRLLECHAWLTPFDLGTSIDKNKYSLNEIKHPTTEYPDLCIEYSGRYYFDPGIPKSRELIYEIYNELASEYDFDGINLDLTCYHGLQFSDTDSYYNYNPEYLGKENWRRQNLDLFIEGLHDEIKAIAPDLRIGVSPIGVYKQLIGYDNQTAYNYTYQDPCYWINNGWIDYISPKMFHTEKNGFSGNLQKWINESNVSSLVIGISAEMLTADDWSVETLTDQIQVIRENGVPGIAIYSIGDLLSNSEKNMLFNDKLQSEYFRYPSHIALNTPMTSQPPQNVVQEFVGDGYHIYWDAPNTTDVRYYSVYFADENNQLNINYPNSLITAKHKEQSFIYPAASDTGLRFAVTAFDQFYNESIPVCANISGLDDIYQEDIFYYHQGTLYVSSSKLINRIEIRSFYGTAIKTEIINDYSATLNCSHLLSGAYIVTIIYESGTRKTEKIIL